MTNLLFSAIVLNYRSPQDSVKCVQALCKQTIADQMEILVIDNHSDDESAAMLRARFYNEPRVRVLENHSNAGFGAGNNLAARQARGDYLLIINPDNIMPPDGVERLLRVLKNNADAGIVGPALVYPDGSVRPSARSFPSVFDLIRKRLFPATWYAEYRRHIDLNAPAPIAVDWLVGACLMMPMTLFRQLNGFDERYFLFFEDIDFCRRVRNIGKTVLYAPCIHVLDRKQRLSDGNALAPLLKKVTRIHCVSAVKYFWKWSKEGYGA